MISTGNYFPLLDGGVERSWLPRFFTLSANLFLLVNVVVAPIDKSICLRSGPIILINVFELLRGFSGIKEIDFDCRDMLRINFG